MQTIPLRSEEAVIIIQKDCSLQNKLNINLSDPLKKYEIIKRLGQGATGIVYHVKEQQNPSAEYALKMMNSKNGVSIKNIYTEFHLSSKSSCPNILPSYELYNFNKNFYIVQKLMHTNLTSFLKLCFPLPESVIAYILKEILIGLNYLHCRQIIHRDIKTENIFLDFEGNIKIGDFGEAAELTLENYQKTSVRGSPY